MKLFQYEYFSGLETTKFVTFFGLRYQPNQLNIADLTERRKRFWDIAFNVDGSPPGRVFTGDITKDVMDIDHYPAWDTDQPQADKETCIAFETRPTTKRWHDYPPGNSEGRNGYVCRKMANQIPYN